MITVMAIHLRKSMDQVEKNILNQDKNKNTVVKGILFLKRDTSLKIFFVRFVNIFRLF